MRQKAIIALLSFIVISTGLLLNSYTVSGSPQLQVNTPLPPTEIIPTVTGTPVSSYIIVNADNDKVNLRSCANATTCEIIGILLPGQKAVARARTTGGMWIQVEYPGVPGGLAWLHSSLVTLYGNDLPAVEPPPTPTPLYTITINPTLAAQFIITIQPSRLPTFTQPAELVFPTYESQASNPITSRVPMGLVITGLASLGVFGALLSVLRGR